MKITACECPATSALDRSVLETAYFQDAYRAPMSDADASITAVFFAVFGHPPWWLKAALVVRNALARWVGLETPTWSDIMHHEVRPTYAVGDKIGPWPVFYLSTRELIAGRDNKHLDFRVSVLKEAGVAGASVVITTVCSVRNLFGKLYLFFVIPFHRWGVQYLISKAASDGRL